MTRQNIFGLAVLIVAVLVGVAVLKIPKPETANKSSLHEALAATYASIPTDGGKVNFMKQSNNLAKEVDPVLVDLDKQIITCSPDVDGLFGSNPSTGPSCVGNPTTLKSTDGMYLGGQCCSTMTDLEDYNKELVSLQKYKDIPDVPMNPFKTPIATAKKWIDYDKATTLTASEQAVYDQAMNVSMEKPCCCKCWHYFVNEGIAKKMIRNYHYSAQQVADYWDTSGICGA